MDTFFWLFVVTGIVMIGLGLVAVLRGVSGVPREDGWLPLAMGASAVLLGMARYRDLPDEDWISWFAIAIICGGLFVEWRVHRHRKARA